MTETVDTKPYRHDDIQLIKGVLFPKGYRFRQFIITGPPGSGKTTLINKIGGWPNEGYIDLTLKNWWRAQALTYRPQEVHLGFPFVGFDDALTVFEKEWLEADPPPALDTARIVLPPAGKRFFFSKDWRGQFVFEFLLPPPEKILAWRLVRWRHGLYPVDKDLTLEQVERQVAVYQAAAEFFHAADMQVYLRDVSDGMPKYFVNGER
jgi:hypothetical protein